MFLNLLKLMLVYIKIIIIIMYKHYINPTIRMANAEKNHKLIFLKQLGESNNNNIVKQTKQKQYTCTWDLANPCHYVPYT